MRMYDEISYAQTRLQGTIVRLGKRPVSVIEISSTGLTAISYLEDNKTDSCKLNDLNIDPVPLGYVNTNKNSFYAVRMPMRNDWKQGLREINLRSSEGMKILNAVNWKMVARTIEGEFTPFKGCLNMTTKGEAEKQAFSRNFCLVRNTEDSETPFLYFKGVKNVGLVLNKKPVLEDKFDWLNEMLQLEFEHGN